MPNRRFRLSRKVNTPPTVETEAEKAMREVDQDDADKGSPEMNAAVNRGCSGCLNVTFFFFLIMIASIIATFFIIRKGV